ncbi:MAG: hypothetical protein K0R10_2940 [Alphaproteobacteria bacterium]|jgi:hypothetical protein|nr:hypothetical protein [Alphaproteobacteria bacterium]
MADAKDIEAKVKEFTAALERVHQVGDVWQVPEDVKFLFQKQSHNPDLNDVNVAVFGQLDTQKMIVMAKAGAVHWWQPFTGKAFFGDVEAMRKIYNAAPTEARPNATSAMTWVSFPYKAAGVSNKIEASVLRQLFDWGADVNEKKGEWLEKAVRQLDGEPLKEFVTRGNIATVFKAMDGLKDEARQKEIQKLLQKPTSYVKVDDDTLSETKFIPDAQGGSSFKSLFNFRARRVNEVYEAPGGKTTFMTSASFDDYDSAAIDFAREKLKALGGKPADSSGKSKFKGLASS